MADPTTNLDYAKQRRDDARSAVASAHQQLAQAQAASAANNANLAQATAAFAALNKQADDIRKQLAAAPTSADGDALLDALELLIIRARAKRSAILQTQAELDAARADAAGARTLLSAAMARLAAAEALVKQADQEHKQRAKLKTALGAAPLATINTDADDALKNPPFTDARTRVNDDLSAKLLARAEERLSAASARIAKAGAEAQAAETAALDERDKSGGATGQADKQWAVFARAEAAARDFVNTAKSRFEQAQAKLARVADAKHSPLTPEQAARINDATLKAAREAALTAEETRDATLKDLNAAQDKLAAETLKARADNQLPDDVQAVKDARTALTAAETAFKTADDAWRAKEIDRDAALAAVDAKQAALAKAIRAAIAAKKNPDTDPAVGAAKTELETARMALKGAEGDYKESDRGRLDTWEAAVPDTTWQLVADYEAAKQTLSELKAADPARLKADLEKAEEDYVKARLKADASANVLEQLAAEQAQRAGRLQSARQQEAQLLFNALRGDR